jgi:hypothetical protein
VCILCYTLTGEAHWSDDRLGSQSRATDRARRRRLLKSALGTYGLDYSDDPGGVTSLVRDRKGNVRVVRGLHETWAAATQLAGRPLDPLDPAFLARLDEGTR